MMSEQPMGDIDSGWDNDNFQNMRQIMLNGDWNLFANGGSAAHKDYKSKGGNLTRGPADCANCYSKEMRGLQSQRQNWLKNIKTQFPAGTYENANKTSGNQIYHLNLNLSNICNFKCRMCSPIYSNSLIPDFDHLIKVGSPVRYFSKAGIKQIIDVDNILEQYGSQLSNLTTIWVTGGEPFMDDRLFDFTKKLANYTDISKVRMYITTNGSKVDIEKLSAFDELDVININLSIDATGDLFSYMRSAGIYKWDQVETLIEDLRHWQKSELHQYQRQLSYNASFQTYNSYNAVEFFNYFNSIMRDRDWIEYRMLTNPSYLAVQHMPQHMKDHVGQQLQNLLNNQTTSRNTNTINNMLQSLKTEQNKNSWHEFIRFTVELDVYRNQYLEDYAPELFNNFDKDTLDKFEALYNDKR